MTVRILGCAYVSLFAASFVNAQHLTGRISDVDNNPVEEARIRFEGVNDVSVKANGEFEIDLPKFPIRIEVFSTNSSTPSKRLSVVYPRNGVFDSRPNGSLEIILRLKSLQDEIFDFVVKDGVKESAAIQRVESDVTDVKALLTEVRVAILNDIHRSEDEFVSEVRRLQSRSVVLEQLAPPIDAYLRELKDLRGEFERVYAFGANQKDRAALATLLKAMGSYSGSFKKLNDNRTALVAKFDGLGPGPRSDLLRDQFSQVLTKALDEIHREHVLQMNEALLTLQRVFSDTPPERRDIEEAAKRVAQTAKDLQAAIGTLDRMWAEFKSEFNRK